MLENSPHEMALKAANKTHKQDKYDIIIGL